MVSLRSLFIALMSIVFCWTVPAHAYVDLVPTLAKVITDSKKIAVVEVVEFNRERHVVVLKETRLLKGEGSAEPIQHDVRPAEGAAIPRQILQWVAPVRGRPLRLAEHGHGLCRPRLVSGADIRGTRYAGRRAVEDRQGPPGVAHGLLRTRVPAGR